MAGKCTRSLSSTPICSVEFGIYKFPFMVYGKRDVVYLEPLGEEILLVESLHFEQCIHGSLAADRREVRRVKRIPILPVKI